MAAKRVLCLGGFTVMGFILIALGVGFIPLLDWVVKSQLEKNVMLKNGTQAFEAWEVPPVPVYISFYLFDLVNQEEVIQGGKPKVVQRGPYVYREERPKQNVTFHDNGTVSFTQPKWYIFDAEKSGNCTEEDTFVGLNLPLLTIGYRTRFLKPSLQKVLGWSLHHLTPEKLFQTFKVKDFLWGYKDPVMSTVNRITKSLVGKKYFPDEVGLFTGDKGNGSYYGLYNVHTGERDVRRVNQIASWNYTNKLSYWTTPYCNMINGTDGTLFHPYISKSEKLYLFSPEVCRAAYVSYKKEVEVEGIRLYRFQPPPEMFGDYKEFPDNIGFCVPRTKNHTHCMKRGVLNATICMQGAPLMISQPHFYQADPEYINGVEGMHPQPDYITNLDIEPYTGAVMSAAKKLQFNALLQPMLSVFESRNMKSVIYPILWVNEGGKVDPALAKAFRDQVYFGLQMTEVTEFALIGLGGLTLIICASFIVHKIRRHRRQRNDRYRDVSAPVTSDHDCHVPITSSQASDYTPSQKKERHNSGHVTHGRPGHVKTNSGAPLIINADETGDDGQCEA